MIWYLLFIFVVFLIGGVNNTISKKVFYPPTYLSFLWLVMITAHLYYRLFSNYTPNILSLRTLSYFLLVIVVFSLGGIIAKGFSKERDSRVAIFTFSNRFLNFLLILNCIFLYFFLEKIKELTGTYTNLRIFRYHTSVLRVDIGLIKYSVVFTVFSTVLVLIDFLNNKKPKKIRALLIVLSSFIISIMTGSRGTFFFLILSCLGVYSIFRKINIKLLFKSVLTILTVFIVMATALKKSIPRSYENTKKYGAIEKVEFFLYSYSALPLSAFDKFFNEPYEVSYGDILFRFPKALLYRANIIDSPPKKLVEKYVAVPDRVNVYTAYYKMIKDFGVVYSLIVMLLVGFFHSFFFLNARNRFEYLIGFSVLLFPLTMSFFEENYMSILSTWIQISIYVVLTKFFVNIEYE